MEAWIFFGFVVYTLVFFIGGVFVGKKHAAKIQKELDNAKAEVLHYKEKASAYAAAAEKAVDEIKSKF